MFEWNVHVLYGKDLPMSKLLTNQALTPERFEKFLNALHSIHKSTGKSSVSIDLDPVFQKMFSCTESGVDMYSNYVSKVEKRYNQYLNDIYSSFGPETHEWYQKLLGSLKEYEYQHIGMPSNVIHGDPVFSNAILSNNEIKFVDMRGL